MVGFLKGGEAPLLATQPSFARLFADSEIHHGKNGKCSLRFDACFQEKDRKRHAVEEREGIEKFEGSLKKILAQKWKYL